MPGLPRQTDELHMDCGPFVSVIVPCRNEAMHFQTCLDALLANDYPQNRREILIVDDMSDDGTRELAACAAASDPSIQLLNNPKKSAPAALNMGSLILKAASF